MTDIDRAIAAAREATEKWAKALARHEFLGGRYSLEVMAAEKLCAETQRDLLAALDAARGDAVWQRASTILEGAWIDVGEDEARRYEANGYPVRPLYVAPPAALARGEAVAWKITVVDNTGTHDYAKWAGLQAPPAALAVPADPLSQEALLRRIAELQAQQPTALAVQWDIREAVELLKSGAPVVEVWEKTGIYSDGLCAIRDAIAPPAALAVPAANVTPMRQPRADLARLVESINAAVYANGDGLSVTEAIGALELAKLELLKEQEQ